MNLVKNNIKQFPTKKIPPMWCFGGCNISVDIEKIDTIEQLYYYGNDDDECIPILMITLKDGTKISADFDSAEEAKESLKYYKRWIIKPIQKLV